ncbi:UNVERIFIED_ORG: hypothetical protein ABIB52_002552 [Arthrobacter sp. UYCu721]
MKDSSRPVVTRFGNESAENFGLVSRTGHAFDTNGLLRQYFPKYTDPSIYDAQHLAEAATDLNNRPRKT